jgi:thioredoxin reductase (NADPH)
LASWDLIIIGAGPTGLACSIEAEKAGLRAVIIEKGCVVNSIYNYPTNMVFFTTSELLEIGGVPFTNAAPKPNRLEALEYYRRVAARYQVRVHQYERADSVQRTDGGFVVKTTRQTGETCEYRAPNVVIATGYYDLPNRLNIPGEDLPHVFHYYREAHPFAGSRVAIIGGKNFAAETALDLYRHGAQVTMIHRGAELSHSIKYWVRPDIENRIKAGEISAMFRTTVHEILPGQLRLRSQVEGGEVESTIPADFVLALIGYHPDFEFLRASGVELSPEMRPVCDPETYETTVPGLYLAGVVVAGRYTSEIFIENGRFHGKVIVDHILQQRAVAAAQS